MRNKIVSSTNSHAHAKLLLNFSMTHDQVSGKVPSGLTASLMMMIDLFIDLFRKRKLCLPWFVGLCRRDLKASAVQVPIIRPAAKFVLFRKFLPVLSSRGLSTSHVNMQVPIISL